LWNVRTWDLFLVPIISAIFSKFGPTVFSALKNCSSSHTVHFVSFVGFLESGARERGGGFS
jgi:hypothetical protein